MIIIHSIFPFSTLSPSHPFTFLMKNPYKLRLMGIYDSTGTDDKSDTTVTGW